MLVDVVVRDKKLRLVRDLKGEDFQVLEDGVRQTVKTFRFIGGADAAESLPAGSEARGSLPAKEGRALNPMREINLISVVVDSLGADGRTMLLRNQT